MDTVFSIQSIIVSSLAFGPQREPIWDVTVIVAVVSEFENFDLSVPVQAPTLDSAVVQAMQEVMQWGPEFGRVVQTTTSAKARYDAIATGLVNGPQASDWN